MKLPTCFHQRVHSMAVGCQAVQVCPGPVVAAVLSADKVDVDALRGRTQEGPEGVRLVRSVHLSNALQVKAPQGLPAAANSKFHTLSQLCRALPKLIRRPPACSIMLVFCHIASITWLLQVCSKGAVKQRCFLTRQPLTGLVGSRQAEFVGMQTHLGSS